VARRAGARGGPRGARRRLLGPHPGEPAAPGGGRGGPGGRPARPADPGSPAVADGVASAVRLWHHGRGLDPVLAAFLDHRPADPPAWEGLALLPCRRALCHAGEPGSGRPGDLFRHHPGGPS
jgi:hypothetical protein